MTWRLAARRNSRIACHGENNFTRLDRVVQSQQNSSVYLGTTGTFLNNSMVFNRGSGSTITYDAEMVFTGNTINIADESTKDTLIAETYFPEVASRFRIRNNTSGSATLYPMDHFQEYRYSATLSGALTISLSTTQARNGTRFRVVAPSNLAGNTFTVNGKSLLANQWIEWVYDGSAYQQMAGGTRL